MANRKKITSPLRLAFLVFIVLASPTFAHGIRVSASVEGKTIHGRVTFQGGNPVKNCTVTGHDAADKILAKTTTDDDGRFAFEARWRCDYHVEAETDDGHGGETIVKAALLPSDLPSRNNQPDAEHPTAQHTHRHAAGNAGEPGDENPWTVEQIRVLQMKLDALQEKLDDHEKSLRLRDILGGIGYIFGVFGLYAIFATYRKKTTMK